MKARRKILFVPGGIMINNNLIVGVPIAKENYKKFVCSERNKRITDKISNMAIEYLLYCGVPQHNINQVLLTALHKNKIDLCKRILKNKRTGKCAICGSKKNLSLHHLTPVNESKALKYRNSNLITLCTECHRQMHSY